MIKLLTSSLVLAATAVGFAPTALANQAPPESGVAAVFEGTTFDMSRGWGAATACHVTDNDVTCYRSEADMDRALNESASASRASDCSTALRLYDGTSHTGAVISLSTRQSLLTLSAYGFDNRTSSYRVGACAVSLYNGIGTSKYGGNTSANASATSMASGWNNVISSVVIA
jgi:hypothetical protein